MVQSDSRVHVSKSLLDEEVVVFPAMSLERYLDGRGLHCGKLNSEGLLAECHPMRRIDAEEDTSVIQLISVFIIRYRNRFLTYKRSKRLPEARLHNYYSVVFGGHVTSSDIRPLLNIFVPDQGLPLLMREMIEEVKLPQDQSPKITYRGILYDDSRPVSKQHLGIVYDVELRSNKFEIGERAFLVNPQFETVEQIRERIFQFENWSVLLLDHLVRDC